MPKDNYKSETEEILALLRQQEERQYALYGALFPTFLRTALEYSRLGEANAYADCLLRTAFVIKTFESEEAAEKFLDGVTGGARGMVQAARQAGASDAAVDQLARDLLEKMGSGRIDS